MRVLIVDDEPPARRKVRRFLEEAGPVDAIAEAGAGSEAIEAIRSFRPDLLFLDVQMPDMDGPAVLDALHELDPSLPCVFLTGHSGRYTNEELINRGAVLVVAKPVTSNDLNGVVEACRKVLPLIAHSGADG